MDDSGAVEAVEAEVFQDSVLRERFTTIRAQLVAEITAVRDALKTSSDGNPGGLPDRVNALFEHAMDPSRLDRMATFTAEQQYRKTVHKQYFQVHESSNSEHVAAISSAIADRKTLCAICRSAAEQISAFILAFDKEVEERPKVDEFWPPRPMDHAAYIDGHRLIPPEEVQRGDYLPPNVIQHHRTAHDLVSSAETCPLCELLRIACIMDSFREVGQPFDHAMEPLAKILASIRQGRGSTLFDRILDQLRSSEEPLFLMLWREGNLDHPRNRYKSSKLGFIRLVWKRPAAKVAEKERKVVYTRLQVYHSRDTAPRLTPYISHRGPLQSSESSEAFELLRNWFQACQNNHPECRKTISSETINLDELHKLPRRLLDVGCGSDGEPRLIDTTGYPDGKWVALSHCWGDPQNHPLKTTRETLADHMRGIPLSLMPKTFIHAIAVTKALGFRYIWIDSLCIVQDDEHEWLTESQDMGTIYERAALTLAASSAVDSTRGLFLQRDYSRLQVPSARLPFLRKDFTSVQESLGEYSVGIEWRQEPFMKALDPMDSTLSTRGWATQEWILSRRIIHFLDRGIVWVCRSWAEDETGHFLVGRDLPCSEWSTEWARIIQEHSARKFTRQSDRLISLEGLARKFEKLRPFSRFYSFGTWESDMPGHLLWSPKMLGGKLTDLPSWSWASCPYEIWFRFRDVSAGRDCLHFWPTSKILGLNKTTGRLGLRAKMIEMNQYLTRSFESDDDFTILRARAQHWCGHYIAVSDEAPCGWAVYDNGRNSIDPMEPIFFLFLAAASFYISPFLELYGLLLAKDPSNDNGYVRVGIGALSNLKWLEDVPLIDIGII